jgi:hypothetical protein
LPGEDTRPVGGEAGTDKELMRGMEEEEQSSEAIQFLGLTVGQLNHCWFTSFKVAWGLLR